MYERLKRKVESGYKVYEARVLLGITSREYQYKTTPEQKTELLEIQKSMLIFDREIRQPEKFILNAF